jgi:hypothetical protein
MHDYSFTTFIIILKFKADCDVVSKHRDGIVTKGKNMVILEEP